MVSFDDLVLVEGVPIYQQILRHVKLGIAGGTIPHGETLPSRRVVSALLGVNPNTVQKAYRLLEEEGLIQSRSGAKSSAPQCASTKAPWPPTRPPGPGCGGTCSGRRPSPWWPP